MGWDGNWWRYVDGWYVCGGGNMVNKKISRDPQVFPVSAVLSRFYKNLPAESEKFPLEKSGTRKNKKLYENKICCDLNRTKRTRTTPHRRHN